MEWIQNIMEEFFSFVQHIKDLKEKFLSCVHDVLIKIGSFVLKIVGFMGDIANYFDGLRIKREKKKYDDFYYENYQNEEEENQEEDNENEGKNNEDDEKIDKNTEDEKINNENDADELKNIGEKNKSYISHENINKRHFYLPLLR